ncbi:TolC family outer membrane protein [Glacieibacterium sp.]|uniref:TolC family outer membrane protein n=1 Tax=Glacieibacterium sp. TaxID=2860237 RepID=UPI003B00E038
MVRLTSVAALAIALLAQPALADTLSGAIASAYETNPDLAAQRAVVRQVDEQVPQALSFGRPTVDVSVSEQQNGLDFADNGRTSAVGLSINQSLYRGGRTRSATNAADARVLAARSRLRATENTVILNTVTAYADVLRYAALVDLNASQVKVLERELQASKDRFEVGDLTRTDVAQSQARLENARSNYIAAQGTLSNAREYYRRTIGRLPEDLAPLPPLPVLPGTQGQAIDLANANNPALLAARFDEAAARYDVSTIERERLPSVGVGLGANYQKFNGGGGGGSFVQQGSFFTQSAGIQLSVPIYQAGAVASRVREAQARRSQLLEVIGSTGRQVVEQATNSFVQIGIARAIIQSSQVAVDANALALEGVTQENQVGTRTVLEVLNAQQELLSTRTDLLTAQRNEYVAGYTLLAAVGVAEAAALEVPVNAYDSTLNAKRVRHKWNDFDLDPNAPALPLPDPVSASRSVTIPPR